MVRDIRRAFATGMIVVGVSAMLTIVTVGTPATAVVLIMVWGSAFGAVPVCLQRWTLHAKDTAFQFRDGNRRYEERR